MAQKDIMVDLETMGQHAGAAIVAIGAAEFSVDGVGDQFYVNVDLNSCVEHGLNIDPNTLLWWMQQSSEARSAITNPRPKALSLPAALTAFDRYVGQGARIWGNGADFDNAILSAAYKAAAMPQPWAFWDNRCYRTLKGLFRDVPKPERQGTHHNALDDAKFQATHAVAILRAMK